MKNEYGIVKHSEEELDFQVALMDKILRDHPEIQRMSGDAKRPCLLETCGYNWEEGRWENEHE